MNRAPFAAGILIVCAVGALGCSQAHECAPGASSTEGCGGCLVRACRPDGTWGPCFGGGAACDAGPVGPVDGGCAPGAWRACERFCTFERCTTAGTWSGECVEHGGPCDVGPRADSGSEDATSVLDADVSAQVDADIADGGLDAAPCDPTPPNCLREATCVEWGASAAPPGTLAATMCGVGPVCTRGTTNCVTAGAGTWCQCSDGFACAPGQICVSDMPGGPTRCAQACSGR